MINKVEVVQGGLERYDHIQKGDLFTRPAGTEIYIKTDRESGHPDNKTRTSVSLSKGYMQHFEPDFMVKRLPIGAVISIVAGRGN